MYPVADPENSNGRWLLSKNEHKSFQNSFLQMLWGQKTYWSNS